MIIYIVLVVLLISFDYLIKAHNHFFGICIFFSNLQELTLPPQVILVFLTKDSL